jgi:hypothetical protein
MRDALLLSTEMLIEAKSLSHGDMRQVQERLIPSSRFSIAPKRWLALRKRLDENG